MATVKVKSSGVDKLVGDDCRVMGGFEMWEWIKTQLKKTLLVHPRGFDKGEFKWRKGVRQSVRETPEVLIAVMPLPKTGNTGIYFNAGIVECIPILLKMPQRTWSKWSLMITVMHSQEN